MKKKSSTEKTNFRTAFFSFYCSFFMLLFTGIATNLIGQPTIDWQNCYGGSSDEQAIEIHQTMDKGYILVGSAFYNDGDVSGLHGGYDIWAIKLDSTGNIDWQHCLGGSASESPRSIKQTVVDSGYIIAGNAFYDDGDVNGVHGGIDNWIIKLDSSGNILWQRCLGGTGNDIPNDILLTNDSGYIVSGFTTSNDLNVSGNHGAKDFWIVKLDSLGFISWSKCLGGTGNDIAESIKPTADKGYIIVGSSTSDDGDVSTNHGAEDFWVVKLDSSGSMIWQKSLGGSNSDIAKDVVQTFDGGYAICGSTMSDDGDVSLNHGDRDFWIVKLDSSGSILWQRCLGGNSDDAAFGLIQTTDAKLIACGLTNSTTDDVTDNHGLYDYWITELDANGNKLWSKCFGGTDIDEPADIQQTLDAGFIVAGFSSSNDHDVSGNHGQTDIWVVKLNAVGTGINNYGSSAFDLYFYPNPAQNNVRWRFNTGDDITGSYAVFDVLGKVVLKKNKILFDNHYHMTDLSTLPEGTYFFKWDIGHQIISRELVINR